MLKSNLKKRSHDIWERICANASGVTSLLSLWHWNTTLAASVRPISRKAPANISIAPSFLSFLVLFQYNKILYVTSAIDNPFEIASKPRPVIVLSGRSRWTASVKPSGTYLDRLRRLLPVIAFDSLSTEMTKDRDVQLWFGSSHNNTTSYII